MSRSKAGRGSLECWAMELRSDSLLTIMALSGFEAWIISSSTQLWIAEERLVPSMNPDHQQSYRGVRRGCEWHKSQRQVCLCNSCSGAVAAVDACERGWSSGRMLVRGEKALPALAYGAI